MSPAELFILVTARLRNVFTSCDELGEFMGRDASWVSDYYFHALQDLDKRLGSLISLDKLDKWTPHLQVWNAAFEARIQQRLGVGLFGRFIPINCILDGVRQHVATPVDNAKARELINPYLGNHATFVHLGIVAPNSLIIALSKPISGSQNDTGAALNIGLEEKLAASGLVAVCDSIFANTPSQRPIPKRKAVATYSGEERRAISSVRVAVEWAFGDLVTQCPFVINEWKNKVSVNAPTLSFRMAVLITNFKKCCVGGNGNKYFGVEVISPEEYWEMRG